MHPYNTWIDNNARTSPPPSPLSPLLPRPPAQITLSWLHYCALGFYFLVMVITTLRKRALLTQISAYTYEYVSLMESDGCVQGVLRYAWFWFETFAPISLVVTCVYWLAIQPQEHTTKWFCAISLHVFNVVMALTEIFLSRIVLVPIHVVFLIAGGLLFQLFAVLYHHQYNFWIYPFLDTAAPHAVLSYIGLNVAGCVAFFLTYLLCELRNKCARKCVPCGGISCRDEDGDEYYSFNPPQARMNEVDVGRDHSSNPRYHGDSYSQTVGSTGPHHGSNNSYSNSKSNYGNKHNYTNSYTSNYFHTLYRNSIPNSHQSASPTLLALSDMPASSYSVRDYLHQHQKLHHHQLQDEKVKLLILDAD